MRHGGVERALKPCTVLDDRSALRAHLLPASGDEPIERISTRQVEHWRSEQLELALPLVPRSRSMSSSLLLARLARDNDDADEYADHQGEANVSAQC